MFNINIILIIFILLENLLLITNKANSIDDYLDNIDIKYEEYLKKFFMNYLKNNNIISSEQFIQKNEMKKIIVDILLEGTSSSDIEENTLMAYNELADIFIEKYYKEKKFIMGKDLINIINIKELTQKYYELNGESPIYNDDYIFNDENLNLEEKNDNNGLDL